MSPCLRCGIFLLCALLPVRHAPGMENPLPKGFVPTVSEERYGLPEQKLANGSIFDYMDGGGIVYLDHGFRELVHREFSDARNRRITCDCFFMASAAQALAALADPRIAPEGGKPAALAAQNKAYRFPPDYFIYLASDERLIYLHVDDDSLAAILDQFAADILTQQSWIRALDSKFKICSKKISNFKICYKALKSPKEEKK
ncbi:MAG: hypothetical protein NTW95_12355 [Candidatus Aminicenantes bacterium]|nr:hypothetical protein [Candidatus Aminicenantes bacterium]